MKTPRYEVHEVRDFRALDFQVYDTEKSCSVALCHSREDAELIVTEMNSVLGLRDLLQERKSDHERYKRLYGPPERYEGS